MMKNNLLQTSAIIVALLGAMPTIALAAETSPSAAEVNQALLDRIARLETELGDLRELVQQSVSNAASAQETANNAEKTADNVQKTVKTVERLASKVAKSADSASDIQWHLVGYADAGFVASSRPGADSFVTGKFNPAFHFQYKDFFLYESELEFTTTADGETNIELEYSQFNIFLNDYATLVVGKYLSPIGQFQERLHPSWINKMQTAPAGFGHDGIQPSSDTGLQLRGAVPLGNTRLAYSFMVGNGPRTNIEGGVKVEGMGSDDNSNKSFGGRIGFFPVPYLELGGSYLNAKVNGYAGGPSAAHEGISGITSVTTGPTDATYELWGFDAAYTKGPLHGRFEYLNSTRDTLFSVTDVAPTGELLPQFGMEAWYGQVSYRLSGLGDSNLVKKLEPVIRYGEFRITGRDELSAENSQNRFNLGLNYWMAPTVVTKVGLEWRDYKDAGVQDDTRYQFQVSYGF